MRQERRHRGEQWRQPYCGAQARQTRYPEKQLECEESGDQTGIARLVYIKLAELSEMDVDAMKGAAHTHLERDAGDASHQWAG